MTNGKKELEKLELEDEQKKQKDIDSGGKIKPTSLIEKVKKRVVKISKSK